MNLSDLLKDVDNLSSDASHFDRSISQITCDSRKATKDSLFVALKGAVDDGSRYIQKAIENGASVVVYPSDNPPLTISPDVIYLASLKPAKTLRELLVNFYGDLSEQIRLVGITGTNGKTTIAHLVYHTFMQSGRLSGMMGTINYRIGRKVIPSVNTTPGIVENYKLLAEMIDAGAEHCIMEVSSHALDQGRVDALTFKTTVFTNLTPDHLDYHKDLEAYFNAKAKLFSLLSPDATAVINADDAYGKKLISRCKTKVLTYGIDYPSHIRADNIQSHISGTKFKLTTPEGHINIHTPLIGIYNIYNIMAAVGVCLGEGMTLAEIHNGLSTAKNVLGRLEKIDCGQDYTVIIDYAHTEDALENVLDTIKQVSGARIILVFGCGGDRDKAKRPAMARAAENFADHIIVTSDNPRKEPPSQIIDDIIKGFSSTHFEVIEDRTTAIKKSLSIARKGDVVLIAGKGHETYQILNDRIIPFDERRIIQDYIRCLQ